MGNSSKHRIAKKGFNLIESAIVLALIGLAVGGIWKATAAIGEKRKINQAVRTC